MDPTTTTATPIPPSSPSSPPPQNPHTPPNAIMDTDCFPDAEAIPIPSNLENLKSLVLKLAGRMLPRHQSLIQQRFHDIFPDELLVPNHPPYADMILTALWELKAEGGSNEEAISDFIENEYRELPWAHSTILNHHLKDLCTKGKITMTQDKRYQRCSSIRKPVPTPNISPSLMSSTFSSSSDSLCSSPSSSSSSFCWGPPYQEHKRKRKRKKKKKKTVGQVGKKVQVRGQGKGRGRPPKTVQLGQQGRSIGTIQHKKRGKGTSMKVEAGSVYNGETGLSTEDHKKVIIGQKVGEECNVKVNQKGDSRGVRRLRKRKYSDEENIKCEQIEGGTKEQERKRKRHNVVWIGRRVRKFNENRIDLSEDESEDDVTDELEEYVDNVKDDVLEKQNDIVGELKVVTDVEVNEPIENKLEDIFEKQNDVGEELKVVTDVEHNQLVEKQHEDITEEQKDIGGELKVVDDVEHNQPVEKQESDILEKHNDVGEERKVATDVERNQPIENEHLMTIIEKECDNREELIVAADVERNPHVENQQQSDIFEKQNDLDVEQADLEKQNKIEKSTEQDQQQKHEIQTVDVQDSVMILCEAQTIVADVGKQDDDDVKEQICHEEHPEKGNEQDESVPQQEQCVENREAELTEEQHTEVNQKEIVLPIDTEVDNLQMHEQQTSDVIEHVQVEGDTKVSEGECQQEQLNQQDSMMSQTESEVKGNKHEDSVSQQELCFENREAELPEEQQTEVNQNEIVLTIDTEVQQNLETNDATACIDVSKEQPIASNEHVQPQHDCTEVDKLQMHEQQTSDVIEQVQLGDTKVSEDQQDSMMSQTESEVETDNKEHENQELHQDQIKKQETVTSEVQMLPLRQGLRSSCKKEEPTSNTKKQREGQTPVRRSLRHQKQFQNQMK
ncbi:uncharacterized protein [Rutidosis leptorrhynchoides]|uniref:uncharacterized protein n=1 Tax=Rutidosis leptorrhynchoides TaxID=125765 RepID=UPI003A99B789